MHACAHVCMYASTHVHIYIRIERKHIGMNMNAHEPRTNAFEQRQESSPEALNPKP